MSRKSEEQRNRMAASLRQTPQKAAQDPEHENLSPVGSDIPKRPIAPRAKPVRITVDLAPDLHRRLKVWAVESDASLADVLRILATRMLDDHDQGDAVRRALHS